MCCCRLYERSTSLGSGATGSAALWNTNGAHSQADAKATGAWPAPPRHRGRSRGRSSLAKWNSTLTGGNGGDGTEEGLAVAPAPSPVQSDEAAAAAASAERAEAVRQAMLHAWRGYERFAMGAAELHPISKRAKQDIKGGQGISGLGVTVVDAMSTLFVMGLKDEFDRWAALALCAALWARFKEAGKGMEVTRWLLEIMVAGLDCMGAYKRACRVAAAPLAWG